jgi:hypothetical protein
LTILNKEEKMNEKFYIYKGYPLVRSGNQLYYGYMSDPYVIWITIADTKEINGEKMTSKVRIVQLDTNEPNPIKAFVRNAERECGLYEALDFAKVWLDKALKNS